MIRLSVGEGHITAYLVYLLTSLHRVFSILQKSGCEFVLIGTLWYGKRMVKSEMEGDAACDLKSDKGVI